MANHSRRLTQVSLLFLVVGALTCTESVKAAAGRANLHSKGTSGYIINNESQRDRVIVFVHGVMGDAKDTWTGLKSAYWPGLIIGDAAFSQFDVYVYDYPSPLFASSYSVDELADNLRLVLDNDAVFEKYKEVIFVCHSMGGLVVRALLLKYQRLAPQVPMIYFFSTPTTGSEVAKLAKLVSRRNPQFGDMTPWRDEAYVANLVRQWLAAQFPIKSYCAYEKQKTFGIKVVQGASATHLCNQRLDPINANHIDIVKPSDRNSIQYIALRQAVTETPPKAPVLSIVGREVRKVTPKPLKFVPPHTHGDRDFDGKIIVRTKAWLEVVESNQRLVLRVSMSAVEPEPDHTTAEGTSPADHYWTLYAAEPGTEIVRVVTPTEDHLEFAPNEDDHSFHRLNPTNYIRSLNEMAEKILFSKLAEIYRARAQANSNNGLIREWQIVADIKGDEAGIHTSVAPLCNEIQIEVEKRQ